MCSFCVLVFWLDKLDGENIGGGYVNVILIVISWVVGE